MDITFLVVGDIHFGCYPATLLYKEFQLIIKTIQEKNINAVIIVGDYFDTRLSLSSPHSVNAIKAFCDLLKACEKKNIKLRVIRGTASHDPENQLNNLANIAKSTNCDFRLFLTVGEEELFPDCKVLYIPEEYMEDKDIYYKNFFNKKYDCIFGHGMFEETNFSSNKLKTMKRYPIFNSKFMENICSGPIVFGHIHQSQIIRSRIMYTGSFTRSRFGEEEAKGFLLVNYNTEIKTTEFEFIENEKAMDYKTIQISEDSEFFSMLINDQIQFIRDLIRDYKKDKLRISLTIPENYENIKSLLDNINTVFGSIEDVTFNIIDNSKNKLKDETRNKINELVNKYNFIFDKSIPYDEKIKQFIFAKKGKEIQIERIRELIYGNVK